MKNIKYLKKVFKNGMIIHIIIYIIYCISILGFTFLTFLLKYKYLFSKNHNFYLLFVSFCILLDGIDILMLGINKPEEKIYYILYFLLTLFI